jgi:hypothetical protein
MHDDTRGPAATWRNMMTESPEWKADGKRREEGERERGKG